MHTHKSANVRYQYPYEYIHIPTNIHAAAYTLCIHVLRNIGKAALILLLDTYHIILHIFTRFPALSRVLEKPFRLNYLSKSPAATRVLWLRRAIQNDGKMVVSGMSMFRIHETWHCRALGKSQKEPSQAKMDCQNRSNKYPEITSAAQARQSFCNLFLVGPDASLTNCGGNRKSPLILTFT